MPGLNPHAVLESKGLVHPSAFNLGQRLEFVAL